MGNLRSLTISDLYLSQPQFDALVCLLASNPTTLQHLDLSWLHGPGSIASLPPAIKSLTSLMTLSLAHLRIPASSTGSLLSIIKKNPLKHLNLSGCLTTAR